MEKKWLDESSRKLLEKIVKEFYLSKERRGHLLGNCFHKDFMETMFSYLAGAGLRIDSLGMTCAPLSDAHKEFFNRVLPEISVHSRTREERDALVMVLMEKMLGTISQPIYSALEGNGLIPVLQR